MTQWHEMHAINNMDKALEKFSKMFVEMADEHALVMKFTVRKKAPWIDEKVRALLKMLSIVSGNTIHWKSGCSLRSHVKKKKDLIGWQLVQTSFEYTETFRFLIMMRKRKEKPHQH